MQSLPLLLTAAKQRKSCSAISVYANFLPFITAILTCVLFIIAVLILFKDSEKLKKAFKILVITAFAVASLSFAFMNLTVTAALISLMLAFTWLSAQLIHKA